MQEYLKKNGLIGDGSYEKLQDFVRDRADVSVWKCPETEVIFLEKPLAETESYYENKEMTGERSIAETVVSDKTHKTVWPEDDYRRFDQYKEMTRGKVWLDVGAGEGGFVELISPYVEQAIALELNKGQCDRMRARGLTVFSDIQEIEDNSCDVISLFHVLEHFDEPIEILSQITQKLKTGGMLIVEVPHARDFLIQTLDNKAFQEFTFWSEHLVLHTRNSLRKTIEATGMQVDFIQGTQRYHLANHLYWAQHELPGGHGKWPVIDTAELKQAYENMLNLIDQTDTLTAIAIKKED